MEKVQKESDEMRIDFTGSLVSLTEMSSRLSGLTEYLETAVRNAEPGFIKIGNDLQSIHSDARSLTRRTLQAVESISSESEDSVLLKIKKAVKDSFSKLESCQTGLSVHLSHGREIVKYLGDLYLSFAGVKKIAKSLSVLGVYIRIESSRSLETFEMFETVASEIKHVSEKVGGISQDIREEVKTERINQITVNKEISDGLEGLAKLAEDAEQAVKSAVRDIEQITNLLSTILAQAVLRSEKISDQISELVVNIQFYDSMYQRIDHIATALRDVGSSLKGDISAADIDDETAKNLRSAHSVIEIQTAQLGRIRLDIENVYQQSKAAFEKLIEEVDRFSSDFSNHDRGDLRFRELRKANTSDSFENLRLSLENFHDILDQGQILFERLEAAGFGASLTANKLSDQTKHVHSINLDTHILALNSIIKAEHLGTKGKNLKVLANEITSLSNQTKKFVSSVEELLESIISIGRKLHDAKIRDSKNDPVKTNTDEALDKSIHEISLSYDRFIKDSSDIYTHSETLKDIILKMNEELDFLCELSAELEIYFRQLKDIEKALTCFALKDHEDDIGNSDKFTERYTMEKEREIHREITGIGKDLKGGKNEKYGYERLRDKEEMNKNMRGLNPIIISEADEAEECLGDNVELF